jgi:hypothetical protein
MRQTLEATLEMQQPAERPLPDRGHMHRHLLADDVGRGDVPIGLAVATGRALEQFARRRHRLAERRMGERIGRVAEEQSGGVGPGTGRLERGVAHLVEPIIRRRQHRASLARRGGCAAEFTNRHCPGPTEFFIALQHFVAFLSYSQHNRDCFPSVYAGT